jgi:glycosyltransferase involved in cell wall biosynthesis
MRSLQRLLECWQWASGPIGDQYPLVILGLPEQQREALHGLVRRLDLGETVRSLPDVPVELLSTVYRGCSVYFHPAPFSAWGDPVQNALACGIPVVAAESPLADAIVGPAAYLAPGEDTRSLGAALLTVIVEEEVAGDLAQSARQRSREWRGPAFGQALREAYRQILTSVKP